MRLVLRAALILSAVAFASAATAQPTPGGAAPSTTPSTTTPSTAAPSGGLITQFNADQVAQLFTAAGFASKSGVEQDNKTPMVSTQFWPNITSGVIGNACDSNNACPAYTILAIFPNEQAINDTWTDGWNSKFLFIKAYKDGDNLIFEWDVMLAPGVTPDYVEATAQVFKAIVDQSTNFKP
jgi:hypothetical protein